MKSRGQHNINERDRKLEIFLILGSLLDTTQYIQRRKTQDKKNKKTVVINAYKKKENIYKSNKVALKTKLCCFNSYTASIVL